MTWRPPSARERVEVLRTTRSVTVVGASADPARASSFVATYLLASSDYTVHLVNPRLTTLMGRRAHPSLADLPEPPDLVSVFRRADQLPAVADEAIEAGARTLWLQLGLHLAGFDTGVITSRRAGPLRTG